MKIHRLNDIYAQELSEMKMIIDEQKYNSIYDDNSIEHKRAMIHDVYRGKLPHELYNRAFLASPKETVLNHILLDILVNNVSRILC